MSTSFRDHVAAVRPRGEPFRSRSMGLCLADLDDLMENFYLCSAESRISSRYSTERINLPFLICLVLQLSSTMPNFSILLQITCWRVRCLQVMSILTLNGGREIVLGKLFG
jgi:hypothetical protein